MRKFLLPQDMQTKIFFLIALFLLVISCGNPDKNSPPPVKKQTEKQQSLSNKIQTLYKDGRYFELRDAVKSAQRVKQNSAFMFYHGAVKSLFNETDSSIVLLDNYLRMSDTSQSLFHLYAYQLQAVNYNNKDNPQKTFELIQK